MLNHRWALIEKDFGNVSLVELTALTPEGGVYEIEGVVQSVPLHAVLTRSNSRDRMERVATLFQQAWDDASGVLDRGKDAVEDLRPSYPAGAYLDQAIEAAKLRFHTMRDTAWRQALNQLRQFPIDPLSPALDAATIQ